MNSPHAQPRPGQRRSRSTFSILFFAILLLLVTAPLRAADDGIRSVVAATNLIEVSGFASAGPYRLVEFAPNQIPASARATAIVARVTVAGDFSARFPRFDGARDRLYSSFMAWREADGTLTPAGTNRFVEDLRGIARFRDSFPVAASKKGLQVQMVDDALALGVKHAALNVNLTALVDLSARSNSLPWLSGGRAYHFHRGPVDHLDRQIQPLSQAGVVVSLILLTYASGEAALNKLMLHPDYDPKTPNRLGNFNTVTDEGVRQFTACLEFLANRYSQSGFPHGRAVNFIIGNEVNSHWFWANMGRVGMEAFADDYLRTVRLAHTALRQIAEAPRVYLSLEHHWNIRYPGGDARQTFPARPFLDYFHAQAQAHGDFDWHVAFHPYPENLFRPATWNDQSATTNENTPRITFKNLELLPRYFRRAEMRYRGQPRHLILSEQGFHTPDGPEGEKLQAAAYAYAYYKTAQLDGIDSFILHRHVDHPHEGGLKLGLWKRDETKPNSAAPASRKQIYDVFLHADQPDWRQYFDFALPVIGAQRWEDLTRSP